MRELKYHEQKLLKKVNFLQWKSENNLHEIKIMRRYLVQGRDDYLKYNKIAGYVTKLVSKLKELPSDVSCLSPFVVGLISVVVGLMLPRPFRRIRFA